MKIKVEKIGSKAWSKMLSRWIKIEEGKEDFYLSLGFVDIFEQQKPKLIKDVKNTKKLNDIIDSDSDRTDDSESGLLSV
jgi:hypothetical protein